MKLQVIYSALPTSIIAIYTQICKTPYAIINKQLNKANKQFIKHACQYLHKHNSPSHILQFDNLTELDHEAFKYASDMLAGYNINGDAM